jgi:hypothetical protein
MMFCALFRPGYDKIVAFTSLVFVISMAMIAYNVGDPGIEVFFSTFTWTIMSIIVSAMVYFIRKLLFVSLNLQFQAEASTKSMNDLLNSLPDSVLLLSKKTL